MELFWGRDLIEVEDIRLVFGGHAVVRGFSLAVRAGEKVALFGPSGSGKSSILRCLLGFVRPAEGRVVVDGMEMDRHTVWEIRRRMGYVPQEADLGEGTAREAVERPFAYHANAHLRGNLGRLAEMLDRLGLSRGVLEKEVRALSGGEKQRLALAATMLLDRRALLLDEISSALDEKSVEAVAGMLRESGQTVVLVTHDRRLTAICDRVVDVPLRVEGEGA